MLRRILLCTAILAYTTTAYCQNALQTPNIEDLSDLTISDIVKDEVFFTDPEKKVYYIDFEATKTRIVQLQLWKNNEELVKNEETVELPQNTIYELNIEKLAPGEYSIELTTEEDDAIIQVFKVKELKEEVVNKDGK